VAKKTVKKDGLKVFYNPMGGFNQIEVNCN
jgi:hypothetical protein